MRKSQHTRYVTASEVDIFLTTFPVIFAIHLQEDIRPARRPTFEETPDSPPGHVSPSHPAPPPALVRRASRNFMADNDVFGMGADHSLRLSVSDRQRSVANLEAQLERAKSEGASKDDLSTIQAHHRAAQQRAAAEAEAEQQRAAAAEAARQRHIENIAKEKSKILSAEAEARKYQLRRSLSQLERDRLAEENTPMTHPSFAPKPETAPKVRRTLADIGGSRKESGQEGT